MASYEVPLHDIVWSLGSICALSHRAFDADLVLRELPAPPLTTDTLITAGRSLQFRVQPRDVSRAMLAKLTMPCLGVLHDIAPPVAPQPVDSRSPAGGTGAPRARMALIVRVDETQVLLFRQFQQASLSVIRLGDIMNAVPEPYSVIPGRVRAGRGLIEIEQLSFRYAEQLPMLLKGLTLRIEPGRVVAFMGASGCGKSTLAKLLQGMYRPSDGRIKLDGNDITYGAPAVRQCLESLKRRWLAAVAPAAVLLCAGGPLALAAQPPVPAAFQSGFTVQFKLTQGRGTPVCDAYLDLLNRSKFPTGPYCGRPNNDVALGFPDLKRRDLSAAEIVSLFNLVHAFLHYDNQHHPERTYHPAVAPGQRPYWSDEFETPDSIKDALNLGWTHVWIYTAPVNLTNDGVRDNVLIWQGYGADENGVSCGSLTSHSWDFSYVRQLAIVLTADGKQIDEKRTRAIFGAQGQASETRATPPLRTDERPFRPLADSIDMFRYGDRYYIDTEDVGKESDPAEVSVYLHEHEHMQRVCTLRSTEP